MHGNQLSGSIPSSFRNLESLTYLYVLIIGSRNVFSVIVSCILTLPSEMCRNLSKNNFKGRIPTELGQIINLDTL